VQYTFILEYDGTNYHGWQLQPNAVTLQGRLEAVLARLFNEPIRVRAAGRTDTGVHALGQVVSFHTRHERDLFRLQGSINALLPSDMAVKQLAITTEEFNPRRDARSRTYRYQMWNQPSRSAIWARYSWHIPIALDIQAMDQAAALLVGDHDFSSFQGSDSVEHDPLRTVLRSTVRQDKDFLIYDVEARSFLRHMVRNIVGTLFDVGRGVLSVEEFAQILAARDRTQAGQTAPPQGLFFVEVKY
jgi:tRNA pseudouridine38-40 synthase